MTLLHPRDDHDALAEREALIKEARRLRRRRWLAGSTLAALAAGAGVAGVLLAGSGPAASARTGRGRVAVQRLPATAPPPRARSCRRARLT